MKLNRAIVKNLKSYYPAEEVLFGDGLNVFVGPNGGGKSNLFELIQGAISSVIYKHVTITYNTERANPNSANYGYHYKLQFDNWDPNLIAEMFERHYSHTSEESSLELYFSIKEEDINILKEIAKFKEDLVLFLKKDFQDSGQVANSIERFFYDDVFESLIGTTLKIVIASNSIIGAYSDKPELSEIVQRFFEILPYFNVLYEISALSSNIKIAPNFRYIGPHRNVNQVQKEIVVDLTQNNIDKNFAKGLNQSKDTYIGIVDTSYQHIVRLYDQNKNSKILTAFRKVLERYLSMSFEVIDQKIIYHHEYRLRFFRLNGMPIKLSSGEKEFFSLISGIVLSELKDGLVLLDEPELHQHTQWQKVLTDLIQELSVTYNLQFLIITHSPQIIVPPIIQSTYRIYKHNDCSKILKPNKSLLDSSSVKDLLQIINSSNNEKVFFADKVILVEGISDQLVFSKSLSLLRGVHRSDEVIEVLPVGSKNNLLKYRKFLNTWKIKNYIVADLDILKDLSKERSLLQSDQIKTELSSISTEIDNLYSLNTTKLKDVLIRSYDGASLFNLIKTKKELPKEDFLKAVDSLTDKIIKTRAISIRKRIILSANIKNLLKNLREQEMIFVLENGCLENCFSGGGSVTDKVEFAIGIVKSLNSARGIKKPIREILKYVLKD
ncbi:MAG: AAA family ATPase [Patescibacteria group bacterium]|jgi:predicted ATP-dependent endonuclease of OLD family